MSVTSPTLLAVSTAFQLSAAPVHVIPFELIGDHVMVRGTVGGAPAWLLIDTGSGMSSLDASWAAGLPLRPVPETVQVSGTGSTRASIVVAPSIRIGEVELRDVQTLLLPLAQLGAAKGHPLHAVIGFDLFNRFVVEIDYPRRELRLHDPATYVYRGAREPVEVALDYRVPVTDVEVRAGGRSSRARVVVDIGSSLLSVRLSPRFRDELGGPTGVEAPLGTGVGGRSMGTLTRLDELRFAGLRFPGPTAGIAHEAQGVFRMFDGSIGVPVFSVGTLIVDYSRSRVILEPSRDNAAPPEYDASGLSVTSRAGEIAVDYVIGRSPAAEADIRVGDIIESVDGIRVIDTSLDSLRQRLRQVGTAVRLTLRRGQMTREANVALRKII